jgi:RNA polymerase sigma-70 factor (ECF subfamily)
LSDRELAERFHRLPHLRRALAQALWKEIEERYGRAVRAIIRRRFGLSRSDARDLWQETMLIASTEPGRFDPGRGTLKAWLTGIARNLAMKFIRDAGKLAVPGGALTEVVDPKAPAARLSLLVVEEVLDRLPAADAALLRARYLEGRTLFELAERHEISRSTVVRRIASALAALRSCFKGRTDFSENS